MIIALTLLLTGCAARRKPMRGEVVIPNRCIQKLEKTDDTICRGPDVQHFRCGPVVLTRDAYCEQFAVVQKEKK